MALLYTLNLTIVHRYGQEEDHFENYLQKFGSTYRLEGVSDRQVNSLMLIEHSKTIREWTFSMLVEQSANEIIYEGAEGAKVTEFSTSERDHQMSLAYRKDATFDIMNSPEESLSQFLARPVLVKRALLPLDVPVQFTFPGFLTFIQQTRIANRVCNYSYIKGRMHIKCVLNGSPFHYGKVAVAYEPLPAYSTTNLSFGVISTRQMLQLPYVTADVSMPEGSILSYDLINPYGAIELPRLDQPFNDPDLIHVHTLSPMRGVGDTTEQVTLEFYAWMTDVKLSCPTALNITGLVPQSEFDMTMSTAPQTIEIGTIMGNMIAKIMPYAKASYNAIGTGLKIAAAFGFSRPGVVPEYRATIPKPFTNMSNSNVPDSCYKLALDSKNEVTVDPTVAGFSSDDEMNIVSLGKREGFVSEIIWDTTDLPRTILWHAAVTPCVSFQEGVFGDWVLSPSFIAAAPFKYWRGTTYYRIEIIASPFHRGVLRVLFDPMEQMENRSNNTGADKDNVRYSQIIDISRVKNYEFCVGMSTNKNYLLTLPIVQGQRYGAGSEDLEVSKAFLKFPGYIAIQTLIPLTVTGSTGSQGVSPVTINVYMHMGDDFEVADVNMENIQAYTILPDNSGPNLAVDNDKPASIDVTPLIVQSGNGAMTTDGGLINYMEPDGLCLNKVDEFVDDGRLSSIHFGEKITSIRQVIKRFVLQGILMTTYPVAGFFFTHRIQLPSQPIYRGASLVGNNVYGGPVGNFVRTGPLTFWMPCFLGWRGSYRWKIHTTLELPNTTTFYQDAVTRVTFGYAGFEDRLEAYGGDFSADSLSAFFNNRGARTETGSSHNVLALNPVHEVEIPYHYQTRFKVHSRSPEELTSDEKVESPASFYITKTGRHLGDNKVFTHTYVAAGDDFSMLFYKYSPTYRLYNLQE